MLPTHRLCSYNMLLNLSLRSDATTAEHLLRLSFRQYQMEASLPHKEAALLILERERDAIQVEDEVSVAEYLLMLRQLADYKVKPGRISLHHVTPSISCPSLDHPVVFSFSPVLFPCTPSLQLPCQTSRPPTLSPLLSFSPTFDCCLSFPFGLQFHGPGAKVAKRCCPTRLWRCCRMRSARQSIPQAIRCHSSKRGALHGSSPLPKKRPPLFELSGKRRAAAGFR